MSIALYQHLAGKPLTTREKRLCEMISQGMTNKQISAAMGVSQLSVVQYVRAAQAKTKAKNRTALAAHWLSMNSESMTPEEAWATLDIKTHADSAGAGAPCA